MVASPLEGDFAAEIRFSKGTMLHPSFPFDRAIALGITAGSLALGCLAISVFDHRLSVEARAWDLPGDLTKAINLSEAFAHGIGVCVILGAVFLIAVQRRRAVCLAILITASSGLIAHGLKSCFVRIRPYAANEIFVEGSAPAVTWQTHAEDSNPPLNVHPTPRPKDGVPYSFWDARQRSFPSGHAATAWGLAIGLSLMFPRGSWLFGILALAASMQRLTSGAHFPSDIMAGATIAFACSSAILSLSFSRDLLRESPSEKPCDQ